MGWARQRVDRRTFLTASVGASAAAAWASRICADQPPGAIRLAFSLYGAKTLKTADALQACAEIGYDGVELALMSGWPTEPQKLSPADRRELRSRLSDANLGLAAFMEHLAEPADRAGHRRNLDRLKRAIELAFDLAPDAPPPIETVLGGSPAKWDTVKDELVERMRAWAEVAAASKATLAVKSHVGGALHMPQDAVWLVEQVGSPYLKLVYDYSHYQLRGLALAETIAQVVPHSVFIHVKDAQGNAGKFQFLLPGQSGTVDYAEYLRLVQRAGYHGYVTVEVSSMISSRPDYDPRAAARTSYAPLAASFDKAGIHRAGK